MFVEKKCIQNKKYIKYHSACALFIGRMIKKMTNKYIKKIKEVENKLKLFQKLHPDKDDFVIREEVKTKRKEWWES